MPTVALIVLFACYHICVCVFVQPTYPRWQGDHHYLSYLMLHHKLAWPPSACFKYIHNFGLANVVIKFVGVFVYCRCGVCVLLWLCRCFCRCLPLFVSFLMSHVLLYRCCLFSLFIFLYILVCRFINISDQSRSKRSNQFCKYALAFDRFALYSYYVCMNVISCLFFPSSFLFDSILPVC